MKRLVLGNFKDYLKALNWFKDCGKAVKSLLRPFSDDELKHEITPELTVLDAEETGCSEF